jgi:hypothetical protein
LSPKKPNEHTRIQGEQVNTRPKLVVLMMFLSFLLASCRVLKPGEVILIRQFSHLIYSVDVSINDSAYGKKEWWCQGWDCGVEAVDLNVYSNEKMSIVNKKGLIEYSIRSNRDSIGGGYDIKIECAIDSIFPDEGRATIRGIMKTETFTRQVIGSLAGKSVFDVYVDNDAIQGPFRLEIVSASQDTIILLDYIEVTEK